MYTCMYAYIHVLLKDTPTPTNFLSIQLIPEMANYSCQKLEEISCQKLLGLKKKREWGDTQNSLRERQIPYCIRISFHSGYSFIYVHGEDRMGIVTLNKWSFSSYYCFPGNTKPEWYSAAGKSMEFSMPSGCEVKAVLWIFSQTRWGSVFYVLKNWQAHEPLWTLLDIFHCPVTFFPPLDAGSSEHCVHEFLKECS